VAAIQRIQTMLEQMQCPIGVLARFHVDAHERAVLLGASEDVVHEADAEVFRNVEPHRRQLQGDVRVEPLRMDARESLAIGGGRRQSGNGVTMRATGKVRSLSHGSSTFQSTNPSSLDGSRRYIARMPSG